MMAATPFYLAALARVDRLGGGLEATDIRDVPRRALLVTWALVTVLIQAGGRTELFALSSIAVLSQYLVTAAALLALALQAAARAPAGARRHRGARGDHGPRAGGQRVAARGGGGGDGARGRARRARARAPPRGGTPASVTPRA